MARIFTYSSNRFTFSKSKMTFVAEMSEMGTIPRNFGSLYIRSARTGDTRLFLFERAERDASGEDVHAWHFVCPGENYRAVVLND